MFSYKLKSSYDDMSLIPKSGTLDDLQGWVDMFRIVNWHIVTRGLI